MGRASEFTQETADLICERLSNGESLRAICRDADTPSTATVLKWCGQFPEFAEQYARARELGIDALADETLHIADTCDDPAKARVQIDARKWFASKLNPRKYGDAAQVRLANHDGSGDAPVASPLVAELRALLIAPPAPSQALPAPKDGQG